MTIGRVLLTGATGIMGSWVFGEALRRGYEPVILMRDASAGGARERVRTVLHHVNMSHAIDRVHILQSDASQPGLGLSEAQRDELRQTIQFVIHCAACTSFSPEQDDVIWATNVGGVANLLEFLEGTDIPLYHVSTAYVAGRRRGRVYEDELDVGQEFNNTYERSKAASEALVREAFREERLRGSIFRPSIITGSTVDGRILQFMNFYNLLRLIELLARRKDKGEQTFRVAASIEATKNLIPVDWTVQTMWHILNAEGPSGKAYHLTSPNPLSHSDLRLWANTLVSGAGIRFELVEQLEEPISSMESLFMSRFVNYTPYMAGEPEFDRTNTDRALAGAHPFPQVDALYFQQLLCYAREVGWRSLFDRRRAADAGSSDEQDAPQGASPAALYAASGA
jgi:thioester reductase-like protein